VSARTQLIRRITDSIDAVKRKHPDQPLTIGIPDAGGMAVGKLCHATVTGVADIP